MIPADSDSELAGLLMLRKNKTKNIQNQDNLGGESFVFAPNETCHVIARVLSTAHRINPHINLTVPGIETKRNSKSKFTDQTNI